MRPNDSRLFSVREGREATDSVGKISVVMPVFNTERYLHEAVRSILEQTYTNIQLVIVDDGSTDRSLLIAHEYERNDPRVFVISQANKGVRRLAETLNYGLSLCTGDLVTMFPSDDVAEKTRFDIQRQAFIDPEVSLAFGNLRLINPVGDFIGAVVPRAKDLEAVSRGGVDLLSRYLIRNFISQPTVLLRRSILCEAGGYRQPRYLYAEDYPTQMFFVDRGKWVYQNAFLARYRIHPGQMTSVHAKRMIRSDTIYRFSELRRNKNRFSHQHYTKTRVGVSRAYYLGITKLLLSSWGTVSLNERNQIASFLRGAPLHLIKLLGWWFSLSSLVGVSPIPVIFHSRFRRYRASLRIAFSSNRKISSHRTGQ